MGQGEHAQEWLKSFRFVSGTTQPGTSLNHSAEPGQTGSTASSRTVGHRSVTTHTVATRKALFCSRLSPSRQRRDSVQKKPHFYIPGDFAGQSWD